VPFALFAAWRVLGPRLPREVVWLSLSVFLAMAIGTVWFGQARRLDAGEAYAPAQFEDGVVTEGRGVAR